MRAEMRKAVLILLIAVLAGTAVAPVAAAYSLEVLAISGEAKRFPIRVYVSPKTSCPADAAPLFMDSLRIALRNFNGSIDAFISMYPGKFDSLALLKPVLTDREGEATITVILEQLGEGKAGFAELPVGDHHLLPGARVHYDCEVVLEPSTQPVNVILHELLHAFGLGHSNFMELNGVRELMSPEGRPTDPVIYPSTLDLYALYAIWFGGYEGRTIALPPWLEYEMVYPSTRPGGAEIAELEERIEALEKGYRTLNLTIASIDLDIALIHREVEGLGRKVGELEVAQRDVEKELASHGEAIRRQGEEIRGLREEVEDVRGGLGDLREEVAGLSGEVSRQGERIEALSSHVYEQMDALTAQIQRLERVNIILLASTICSATLSASALTLAIVSRRRAKEGAGAQAKS